MTVPQHHFLTGPRSSKLTVSSARVPAQARTQAHERDGRAQQKSRRVSSVERVRGLYNRQEEKREHQEWISLIGGHVVGGLLKGKRNRDDAASGDLAAFPDCTIPTMAKVCSLIFENREELFDSYVLRQRCIMNFN